MIPNTKLCSITATLMQYNLTGKTPIRAKMYREDTHVRQTVCTSHLNSIDKSKYTNILWLLCVSIARACRLVAYMIHVYICVLLCILNALSMLNVYRVFCGCDCNESRLLCRVAHFVYSPERFNQLVRLRLGIYALRTYGSVRCLKCWRPTMMMECGATRILSLVLCGTRVRGLNCL